MANKRFEKKFLKSVARNLTASRLLYRVSTVAKVESEEDIPFWQYAFSVARPGQKVKFVASEAGTGADVRQRGKTVCMRYVDYLNKNFIICVDSDFDRFTRPGVLSVDKWIFQTYTYSFENHYCWIIGLQQTWATLGVNDFNFSTFLTEFSHIIYPVLIEMLTTKAAKKKAWNLSELCGIILSVQPNRNGVLNDNGHLLLADIANGIAAWSSSQNHPTEDACNKMKVNAVKIGLTEDTAYLFMQGHCVFDLVKRIGNTLCNKQHDFHFEVLTPSLTMCGSNEMKHIMADLRACSH